MTDLQTGAQPTWTALLNLPEVVELRRRRRTLTNALGAATIALFTFFLAGFVLFPDALGATSVLGIPLSLWVVFSQFAGTWALVFAYFRLTRTYLQPAADTAVAVVTETQERAS